MNRNIKAIPYGKVMYTTGIALAKNPIVAICFCYLLNDTIVLLFSCMLNQHIFINNVKNIYKIKKMLHYCDHFVCYIYLVNVSSDWF